MSLRFRRILYIAFIIAFVIITPAVLLYAAGYKLGDGFMLHKTGMLVAKSDPEGASIAIRNKTRSPFFDSFLPKKKKIVSPAKIKGLLPGEYEVIINKDGYWEWKKNIYIDPGRTTYIEDVKLLRKTLPIIVENGEAGNLSVSPDKKYLFSLTSASGRITDLKNETTRIYKASSSEDLTGQEPEWSAESSRVIAGGLLFDLDESAAISLDGLLGADSGSYRWHNEDDNILFYVSGGRLMSRDLVKGASNEIIAGFDADDYLVKGKLIYYLKAKDRVSEIISYDYSAGTVNGITELPYSGYSFINPESQMLNLYDGKHRILYLIDPELPVKPIRETLNNVSDSVWIDGNSLLYATEFEIFIFYKDSLYKNLITRLSGRIDQVLMHPSGKYIIYTDGKTVNSIDLGYGGQYAINRLIEFSRISFPFIDQKGETLYFYGVIGNQNGIYKLSL